MSSTTTRHDLVAVDLHRGGTSVARTVTALATAVGAGVALGVLDLRWNLRAPSAWATVANSAAGWATAAFLLTLVLRTGPVRSALSGVVMLAVAVEAYYAAAVYWHVGSTEVLTSSTAQYWLLLSVATGIVFGVAGSMAASRSRVIAAVGFAAGASLCLGDALQLWRQSGASSYGGAHDEAVALAIVGLSVLALALRRPLIALAAAALSLPMAVIVSHVFVAAQISL